MKRYVRLYKIFFIQYMKILMQSKLDFFMGLFSFFINQILGIVFLYLIFCQIPDLNEWTFYQLVFVYGFAQIPRGIDHFITDYLWVFARKTVRQGEFDRYLVRPINPLFQVVIERCQPDGLGEVLVGFILVCYAGGKLKIGLTIPFVVIFLITIISGTLIYIAIKIFFSAMTFYLKDSYMLVYLIYNLSDFAKYPVTIYAKPIRIILSYIIPFAFTAFFPASFFLNKGTFWGTIGIGAVISVVAILISYKFFIYGCKRYESTGC